MDHEIMPTTETTAAMAATPRRPAPLGAHRKEVRA